MTDSDAGLHPVLPPGINETFIVRRSALSGKDKLLYRPGLLASVRVRFSQSSQGIDDIRDLSVFVPAVSTANATVWDDAELSSELSAEQEPHGEADAGFASLPAELSRAKTYTELQTALKDHLYRTQKLQLWKCVELKAVSRPGETEGDFRARITHGVREGRDLQVEKLRAKYAPKLAVLQERLRKAYQALEKQKAQASQQTMTAAVNLGTTILGAILGRKLTTTSNISKAATTIRSAGRISNERQDVSQAEETVEAIQQRIDELNAQFQAEADALIAGAEPESVILEEVSVFPKKTDVTVIQMALCWTPWKVDSQGTAEQAW